MALFKRILTTNIISRTFSVALHSQPDINHPLHVPVMVKEVLNNLKLKPGDTMIDMTFGAGGHSAEILRAVPGVKIFGLDRDQVAYQQAHNLAKIYPGQLIPLLGRFSELPSLLSSHCVQPGQVNAVLIDAGCSSMQFDYPERGFSISKNGPLDMRMDGDRFPDSPTAADVLEHIDEHHLARVLKVYGDEKRSKKIARAIIEARYLFRRLDTTQELSDLIYSICGGEIQMDKLQRPAHVATKAFLALRVFVNDEVNELNCGLEVAHRYLCDGGIFVGITFHSLEDRVVKRNLVGIDIDEPTSGSISQKYKNATAWHSQDAVTKLLEKKWEPVHKHVLTPTDAEVDQNPRSRSARLRAAIKH